MLADVGLLDRAANLLEGLGEAADVSVEDLFEDDFGLGLDMRS